MKANKEIPSTQIIQPKILYFGTPVVLLTTLNEDKSTNITPMSSAFALGNRIVLGLGHGSQGLQNLRNHAECVVNLPDDSLWSNVEALAPLTGANPVPEYKQKHFRFEGDKFKAANLTGMPSAHVDPMRIGECPIQIEARVHSIRMAGENESFGIIEVEVIAVHVHDEIAASEHHIQPDRWKPLIYNFRHYFKLGDELGKTFRAEF